MSKFDLTIIGGGPGGYVAAIKAAQTGMNVAVIEKGKGLGGTCLNIGCIPSKALLDSSEHYYQAKEKFSEHGIHFNDLSVDLTQMMARKNEVVTQTVSGIDFLFKKNDITRFEGTASFCDENTIEVNGANGKEIILTDRVLIATGSTPIELPSMPFNGKNIISSKEALALTKIPKHLIVIGAGAIGLELGSVYARLGSNVTVIESQENILSTMDFELGKTLGRSLKKQGFNLKLSTKVKNIEVDGENVTVTADRKGKEQIFEGDYVLVAVGRKPYTDKLNLNAVGIKTTEKGFISVNEKFQTSSANIFAIGDVIGGAMLAHKAEEEGVAVVDVITLRTPQTNDNIIPGIVYTWPEIASVGRSEENLKSANIAYKIGKFPFSANGRARAANETEGFIKVLADEKSDEILGVHMIGARCSDMIAEAVVAMEYGATAREIGNIIHAHPTFTESFKEAAMAAFNNKPIHI